MTDGSGVREARLRRRSWWAAGAVYTASAAAAGLLARKLLIDHAAVGVTTVTIWVVLAAAGFTFGCWLYWRAMDEVEVRDNLFGAVAGLYAYAIAFPTWWLLWKGGVTAAPNPWAIYLGALGIAGAIYLVRRLQAHI